MENNLETVTCEKVADAIDDGDFIKVKQYIEAGLDVNCKIFGSISLLHVASGKNKNLSIVKYLVSKGGDIFDKNFEGNLPIHSACADGAIKIVEYFINELKMNPNIKGKDNRSTLHIATEKARLNVVEFLVEKTKIDLYAKDQFNQRAIDVAEFQRNAETINYLRLRMNFDPKKAKYDNIELPFHSGDLEGVRYFVEIEQIDPNLIITFPQKLTQYNRISLLDYSVVVNKLDIVKYLISKKADFNARDQENNSCLHKASSLGHLELTRYFISELKMDANLRGKLNQTPLHAAVEIEPYNRKPRTDTVKFLVEETKADLYAKDDHNLRPLEYAEQLLYANEILESIKTHMNLDPVKRIIDHGIFDAVRSGNLEYLTYHIEIEKVDINCIDSDKKSLLILAAEQSNYEIFKYLISKKINIFASDKSGRTALHAACEKGSVDIARYSTIDLKMDPNLIDQSDENCLHKAVNNNHLDVVKYIVENTKIDLSAENNSNENALQISHKRRYSKIEAYLKSKMKNLFSNFLNSKLLEVKAKRSNPQEIGQSMEISKLKSSERDNLRLETNEWNSNLRVQDVDLQSTMLLLNVLFRKFTNQKFITEYAEPSLTEIKMIALNIINSFEIVLEKISSEFNVSIDDFDSTKLISSLTWSLRNRKFEEILKILISAVISNIEELRQNNELENQFNDKLDYEIKKILIKELKPIWSTKMESTSLSADSKLFFKNRLQPLLLENIEIAKIGKSN